jgi:hypothetical protein
MYNADKPIKSPKEDLIGRSVFAQQLADAVTSLSTTDTFVVGLYGEWGSGKTSVLNLTEEFIREHSGEGDIPEVVLIRFNPWGYTDVSQLVQQFFSVISAEVQSATSEENKKAIGDALEKYSFLLNYLQYIPVIGPLLSGLPELAEKIGAQLKEGVLSKENNVQYQKKMVEEALAGFLKKFVVFIDDIDRLPNDQIRMIFQLVNSVANFPNTTYVLSFDYRIVCRALTLEQNCKGEEYLAKIIQIPFTLPDVPTTKIHTIITKKLESQFADSYFELVDYKHWNEVCLKCIFPYINSLRDVNRFMNVLGFKYNLLKDALDPIDLAAITALEMFVPELYSWVKLNKYLLTANNSFTIKTISMNAEELRNQYIEYFQQFSNIKAEILLSSITCLFPIFAKTVNMISDTISDSNMKKYMRIGSASRFDFYFSYIDTCPLLPIKKVLSSYTEMSMNQITDYLNLLLQNGDFVEYVIDTIVNLNDVPDERIELITCALFSVIDKVPGLELNQISLSTTSICGILICGLLNRIVIEQDRFDFFTSLLVNSQVDTLLASASLISMFKAGVDFIEINPPVKIPPVFSETTSKQIESIFCEQVLDHLKTFNLLRSPNFLEVSRIIKQFSQGSYMLYMHNLLANTTNTLLFIATTTRRAFHSRVGPGWVVEIGEHFLELTSVSDANEIINNSINDNSFFELPEDVQMRIAAFKIYLASNRNPNEIISLRQVNDWINSMHINI